MQLPSLTHLTTPRLSFIQMQLNIGLRLQALLQRPSRQTQVHQHRTSRDILVMAIAVILAFVTNALGQESVSALRFVNDTDATIRVEFVPRNALSDFAPQIVQPRQETRINVEPDWVVLDLVAFKTAPNRVHRVMLEVLPNEETYFRLTAHRIGLYLLEDADSLSALSVLPSAPSVRSEKSKTDGDTLSDPKVACQPPLNNWDGVALWQTDAHVQYYRRAGGYLCGVDQQDVFKVGATYERYVCVEGWIDCVRHESGDFKVLPEIRTSEILDMAKRIAQANDPTAFFTQTQEIIGLDEPPLVANMTSYIAMGPANSGPQCPQEYRLHYQGFCINVADELADEPNARVRTVDPLP